jgi:hypothetical protein
MDFEGDDDFANYYPQYDDYDSTDDYDMYDDIDGYGYGSWDEDGVLSGHLLVGVARIPLTLLQSLSNSLQVCHAGHPTESLCGCLPRAWMRALAHKFPDTSLSELRSTCPSLLPSCLLNGFPGYPVRASDACVC